MVPAEPANFAQYVSMFVSASWLTGTIGSRASASRRPALAAGFLATVSIFAPGVQPLVHPDGNGRVRLASLVRVSLETLVCIGSPWTDRMIREVCTGGSRLLAAMATASYAAYILHVYIVVGLQVAISSTHVARRREVPAVAVAGVALSFGIGHFSRTVPRPGAGYPKGTVAPQPAASAAHPASRGRASRPVPAEVQLR